MNDTKVGQETIVWSLNEPLSPRPDLSEPIILPREQPWICREAEQERETNNYWWHWSRCK